MRILYHHRTQADGAEGVHIASMVGALRHLGHEVHMLGREPAEVRTTTVDGSGRSTAGSRIKAALPPTLFELVALLYNVREYVAVRVAIARVTPDLAYLRHARYGAGAILACRHAGVPRMLEVNCLFADVQYHQFEPLSFRHLARRIEQVALRSATWTVAVSSPLAERLRILGAPAVTVMPNGADVERFDPERVDGASVRARFTPDAPCVVGWAGILRAWHGLDLLVSAVARVPAVHLLLVGDGPGRADVEVRARALGMAERLHITGRVAHEDMPAHIAAMDIAVVADDRTGVASPMKLLEYMAMGRAVVAPDLPNVRDVVRPDLDATLFRAGDAAALGDAIGALAANPDARARRGAAARQHVVAMHTWVANARAVETCYARRFTKAVPGAD